MQLGAPPLVTSLATFEIARREQRGLVTRSQCLAAGWSAKAVEWRLSSGRWLRVLPGVYQTYPGRDDWWTWAMAALLSIDDSAWSHRAAAYAWGLVRDAPPAIDLVVTDTRRVRPPDGVLTHRVRAANDRIDPLHWPWRTTVEETVLDLAATATTDEIFAVLGRAFQKRLTDEASVLRRLDARTRHPQRQLLTTVLAAAADGVESAIEGRYLQAVEHAHRLPVGERQLRRADGGRARHDVGYAEQRVLVELDGRLGHDGFAAQIRDGRRDRRGAGSGWLTLRAFWPDVAVTPCELATEVGAVLSERGWAGCPRPCRRRDCVIQRR